MERSSAGESILAAINSIMSHKVRLIQQLSGEMEMGMSPFPGEDMSLADIAQRLEEINRKTREIVIESVNNGVGFKDYTDQLKALMDEAAELKQTRSKIENQRNNDAFAFSQISSAVKALEGMTEEMKQWDETLIRQLVDTVKVVSADEIIVYLHGVIEIRQDMIYHL